MILEAAMVVLKPKKAKLILYTIAIEMTETELLYGSKPWISPIIRGFWESAPSESRSLMDILLNAALVRHTTNWIESALCLCQDTHGKCTRLLRMLLV